MGWRMQLIQLREATDDERQAIERLAHARTASARTEERARVVAVALEGATVEEIVVQLHLARNSAYLWLHRFEARGVAGQEHAPRGGRPPTNTRAQVGEIVATALTDPQTFGVPFQSWTLD